MKLDEAKSLKVGDTVTLETQWLKYKATVRIVPDFSKRALVGLTLVKVIRNNTTSFRRQPGAKTQADYRNLTKG